jgi:hypothetical protein
LASASEVRLTSAFVLIEPDSRLMHFLNGSRTLPETKMRRAF